MRKKAVKRGMKKWIAAVCALMAALLWAGIAFAAGEVYYISAPGCGSCAKMKAALAELGGEGLQVREIGLYEQPELANALFGHYNVPEEERLAPMLFLGTRYTGDVEAVRGNLPAWIAAGEAESLPPLSELEAGEAFPLMGLAGAVGAGLVAGMNPCALSMLLFFMALLLPMERGARAAAAGFLLSKLITYLLIGTLFVRIFQSWNPDWLPMAAKLLLTILGGLMVILNLMDAKSAMDAQYGRIKNQLPVGMRGFLHKKIKGMMAKASGRLVLTAVALGAIVAASEFLCAGQLYLAMLVTALQRGEAQGAMVLQLGAFCGAFLVPSAVLTALLMGGKRAMALSSWTLSKMPLIKGATALVMLLMIVAAWLL